MTTYSDIVSPEVTSTPQSQPIPGREKRMLVNEAGGVVFKNKIWSQLDRFLILGSDEPTYYASAKTLTLDNLKVVEKCLAKDGPGTVARIVEISKTGRAPKNDAAIFALAMAAKLGDDATRRAARDALPQVVRIGTHLFQFADAIQAISAKYRPAVKTKKGASATNQGWSRGLRSAFGRWYTDKDEAGLAYQLIKYRQRDGWTHADLLRLAHPKASPLLAYAAGKLKFEAGSGDIDSVPAIIAGFEQLHETKDKRIAAAYIRSHKLPREAVPTELLGSKTVWSALLEDMPMTAMIRNLATMTRIGLVAPLSDGTKRVVDQLGNADQLRKARVHPVAILLALKTYASGASLRGSNTWTPVPAVIDALNDAFYAAFQHVDPTNKRYLLGVDVSGSMGWSNTGGVPMTPAECAAAMSLVVAKTESQYAIFGFSTTFVDLRITPTQRLDDVLSRTRGMNFGGTDCALPMLYAAQNRIPVDVFYTLTDNETWHGGVHPQQALEQYRQRMGIDAKHVVSAFTATRGSIADPKDPGTLDVVGFDAAVPQIIADFARGTF